VCGKIGTPPRKKLKKGVRNSNFKEFSNFRVFDDDDDNN
jgi:hypothetical protein